MGVPQRLELFVPVEPSLQLEAVAVEPGGGVLGDIVKLLAGGGTGDGHDPHFGAALLPLGDEFFLLVFVHFGIPPENFGLWGDYIIFCPGAAMHYGEISQKITRGWERDI